MRAPWVARTPGVRAAALQSASSRSSRFGRDRASRRRSRPARCRCRHDTARRRSARRPRARRARVHAAPRLRPARGLRRTACRAEIDSGREARPPGHAAEEKREQRSGRTAPDHDHIAHERSGLTSSALERKSRGKKSRFVAHHGRVARVREEDRLLQSDSTSQYDDVNDGADDGGNPRALDERKKRELEKDCDVVRVADEPIRPRAHDAEHRRVNDAHVPVLSEAADRRNAKNVRRDDYRKRPGGQSERHAAPCEQDFENAPSENPP